MNEQAIIAAAREYVAALEELARVRKLRGDRTNWHTIPVYGQDKSFPVNLGTAVQDARAARKRTLTRLKRAVERCRPLPGQKVLFELPLEVP